MKYVSANCMVVTSYLGDAAKVVDEHFSRALTAAPQDPAALHDHAKGEYQVFRALTAAPQDPAALHDHAKGEYHFFRALTAAPRTLSTARSRQG